MRVSITPARHFALLALLAFAGCSGPDLGESLARARASIESSDFATASIHLRNGLKADDSSGEVRAMMGWLALEVGDLSAARDHLEWADGAIDLPEADARRLVQTYAELGEIELAVSALADARLVESEQPETLLLRADLARIQGDAAVAADLLDRAAALNGNSDEIALRRAQLALSQGDATAAVAVLQQLLATAPRFAEALALRGLIRIDEGQAVEAVADISSASDVYIDSGRLLRAAPLLMALVELQLGEADLAAAELTASRMASVLPEAPVTQLALGLVSFRAERYEDAVTYLRPLSLQLTGNERLTMALGLSQLELGNFGQAEREFEGLLARVPGNTNALRLLIEARLRQDRPDAALNATRSYPQAFDDNDPALALQILQANLRAGNSDDAAAMLTGIAGLGSDTELAANFGVLVSLVQQDGLDAGQAFVDDLVARRGEDPVAHLTAAVFHQLRGDLDQALRFAETAIRLDDSYAASHVMRGLVLQRQGDLAQAKTAFEQAISLQPGSVSALTAGARIAISEQDYALAGDYFSRAYAVSEQWEHLADATQSLRLAGESGWDSALASWIRERPEDVRARMYIAEQYRLGGMLDAALEAYEGVLVVDDQHLAALNNAAWTDSQLSGEKALGFATRAAELAPDNGAVLDTLGWILVQQGQPAEGLPHLQRATQLLEGNPEVQYHLAMAQNGAGQVAAARSTLSDLLAGNPPASIQAEAQDLLDSL